MNSLKCECFELFKQHKPFEFFKFLTEIGIPFRSLGVVWTMFTSISATIAPIGQKLFGHDAVTFRRHIVIDPFYQVVIEFDILSHLISLTNYSDSFPELVEGPNFGTHHISHPVHNRF